jgi:hypothetical protein
VKKVTVFFFVLLCFWKIEAQVSKENLIPVRNKIDIPFQLEQEFIIISLLFNNTIPLKFIFDTGAEQTILTEKRITDFLQMDYSREFSVVGADQSTILKAYLVRGVQLRMDKFQVSNKSILVLDEDYFEFEKFTGLNIHGILGADVFRTYALKIDYQKRIISLYPYQKFNPPGKSYTQVPIQISRNKIYIDAQATFEDQTKLPVKLLLDTGAGLSILLYSDTHPDMKIPSKVISSQIGFGLGGFLEGYLGRIQSLEFSEFKFSGVTTNFQELGDLLDSTLTNERNGILGSQILMRFTVIIDYVRGNLYLKPHKDYEQPFKFDKSGLILIAGGKYLNEFFVHKTIENSPAELIGLMPGDRIISINGVPKSFLTLESISEKLKKKNGKKINLKIDRVGTIQKYTFYLTPLI